MTTTAIRVRKYRGAHVLVLCEWQEFISIVYLGGKFYTCKTDAIKKGEYTNREFAEAIDFAYQEAKKLVDAIYESRSIPHRIKKLCHIILHMSRRIARRTQKAIKMAENRRK